jgi:hypothetical protein
MARKKKTPASGKKRTREHVIADMAVLHVQSLVVQAGFTAQRTESDYGYDLAVQTYNELGEIENEAIQIQVKASEDLLRFIMMREHVFSFTVEVADYRLWCDAMLPTFLVLYDASHQEAYWLDIQEQARSTSEMNERYIRLHVPCNNVLGVQTIHYMRQRKLAALAQARGRARRDG